MIGGTRNLLGVTSWVTRGAMRRHGVTAYDVLQLNVGQIDDQLAFQLQLICLRQSGGFVWFRLLHLLHYLVLVVEVIKSRTRPMLSHIIRPSESKVAADLPSGDIAMPFNSAVPVGKQSHE